MIISKYMINWQNRQHKIIIIGSAAILLMAIIILLFVFFNQKSENPQENKNQPGGNSQPAKTYSVPESISAWREKESNRLEKAAHDTALYQEIKISKDANRCQEMQGLNGKEICLMVLAGELADQTICEKISNQEFLIACQEKFKK